MPEGLQFGFPVRSDGTRWAVVEGIEHDDFAQEKIALTTEELVDERDEVKDLLPAGLELSSAGDRGAVEDLARAGDGGERHHPVADLDPPRSDGAVRSPVKRGTPVQVAWRA